MEILQNNANEGMKFLEMFSFCNMKSLFGSVTVSADVVQDTRLNEPQLLNFTIF